MIKAIDESHLKNYEKLATAFRHFDKDGSGTVEAKEWSNALDNCKCSEYEKQEIVPPKNSRCQRCGETDLKQEVACAMME